MGKTTDTSPRGKSQDTSPPARASRRQRTRNALQGARRFVAWFPALWLAIAATRLAGWLLGGQSLPPLEFLYLSLTLAASVVCFFAFWSDKRRARGDLPRIAERSLLALALLGGWPGGLIAGRLFRHKTKKQSFRLQMAGIVVLHVALIGLVVWSWFT